MRARVKLDRKTQASSYVWRFYCESKVFYPNGTVKAFNYPVRAYKTVSLGVCVCMNVASRALDGDSYSSLIMVFPSKRLICFPQTYHIH